MAAELRGAPAPNETSARNAPSYPPLPADALIIVPVRNVVLFPGMPMPLHIFEERYRKMLSDIRAGNNLFGLSYFDAAVSDLEVESREESGTLWHLRYPLADDSGHLVVATTRPETMLGDTAVAVNPEDDRYRHLVVR